MNATAIDRYLHRRRRADPLYSRLAGLQMVNVPHGSIRVRLAGDGPTTVVFACDAPVFIEHYAPLFTLLAPRYRLLCIELPGIGFSVPSPTFGFSLSEQAAAVEQVLRATGVTNCTLAFSCVNGYLALLLARSAPDLVRRVAVLQTPAWDEEKRWARRIDFGGKGWAATPVVGQLLVAATHRVIARRWLKTALGPDANAEVYSAHSAAAFDAGCGWALASLVQTYFAGVNPSFEPVVQPGLVIWGSQDPSHQQTDRGSVLQYFQNAESVTFDDAGHFPELERSDAFVRHLDRLTARS